MYRRDLIKGATVFGLAGGLGLLGMPGRSESASLSPPIDTAQPVPAGPREVLSLNKGWRFFDRDIPFQTIQGHSWTYDAAKAGSAQGAAAPSFNDSEWNDVTLPHDFVSFQPLDSDANVSQGYRQRGIVWYRNTLKFDAADHGKHIELQLEGIATNATIWFNGILVCHNWSGYNSIYIDLTPYVTFGEALNSLVVRADAKTMEGWWYEGGGIYRDVWIVKRHPTHIITDGVYALPVKADDGWSIPVEVTVNTTAKTDQTVTVTAELWDDETGHLLTQENTTVTVAPLQNAVAHLRLRHDTPRLWSVDQPNLYRVVTRLDQDGNALDTVSTVCGFRTQRFDADKGFFLNDQHVKIQGVCLHQDHAGVGVAVPAGIIDFRLRRLKELGCNAIRFSHNAQNKVLMDACDRLGFLVMAENRLFNPSPDYLAQLTWLVRRDRNHPSIYLWSVFNEEPMQGTEAGYEMVRRMAEAVKELDRTRPVTAAMNNGLFTPLNVADAVDVVGINYQQNQYDAFHAAHPHTPMFSSEDTSAFMTRGEYTTDDSKHIMASYDDDAARWGATHRQGWKAIAERDFVAGGFVWTGFDYHGEPTPHVWPTNSSFFGIMDLCGFDKTAFYIHQAQWVKDRPVLWLVPHWNWAGKEGQPIKVMACSNLDEVALYLNGALIGKQPVDPYEMNHWMVPYAPGRLELWGYRDGKVLDKTAVETTGETYTLKITADRASMKGDGWDAQPFRVEAVDSKGRFVPLANHMVRFEIGGGGEIIGLGNGDPNCLESEKGDRRSLFNGLAQVIVRTKDGSSGTLTLSARADGLKPATTSVRVAASNAPAYQETRPPVQILDGWLMAPPTDGKPDPNQKTADNDMNSWQRFHPGVLFRPLTKAGYTLCAIRYTPYMHVQKNGGIVEFLGIRGLGEIYLDGQLLAARTDPSAAQLNVKLPPFMGERRLAVLFKSTAGEPYGFDNIIRVRTA